MSRAAIEVFIVHSAGDLERPDGVVGGVCWTYGGKRKEDVGRKYVILSTTDGKIETLAHELGHWLGLPHVREKGNLMAPGNVRTGVELNAGQRAVVRKAAKSAQRKGELSGGSFCRVLKDVDSREPESVIQKGQVREQGGREEPVKR